MLTLILPRYMTPPPPPPQPKSSQFRHKCWSVVIPQSIHSSGGPYGLCTSWVAFPSILCIIAGKGRCDGVVVSPPSFITSLGVPLPLYEECAVVGIEGKTNKQDASAASHKCLFTTFPAAKELHSKSTCLATDKCQFLFLSGYRPPTDCHPPSHRSHNCFSWKSH